MKFIADESATKLRGGYYTPHAIAHFLGRWVASIHPARVLEPSCGDGALLQPLAHVSPTEQVGYELEPVEASKARARYPTATIHNRDFLAEYLDILHSGPRFDAVIGNPPFVRYQYLEAKSQSLAEEIFRRLGLRFTKHTNAWVPFVLASIDLLRPGGRIAIVVPSELLHVLHAQSLRDFFLRECRTVVVIDPDKIWFDETMQGVVLVLAEKKLARDESSRLSIVRTRGNDILNDDPDDIVHRATFVDSANLPGKWLHAMLSPAERSLLDECAKHPRVRRFGAIATVDVGIVTGANRYFLVTDRVVEKFGLRQWAHPMFGRSEHLRGVIYDRTEHDENRSQEHPTNFLWFDDQPRDRFPDEVQDYFRSGEAQEFHARYKCKIRKPWYRVPSVYSAPVAMLKRSHDYPRLVLNRLKALSTDTAYRVVAEGIEQQLVGSFVNSLTMLSAELEGRHYGGGVLEMVPSEIERLLVPLVDVGDESLNRLHRRFLQGERADSILAARDSDILAQLGMNAADRESLFTAWNRFRHRRQRTTAALPNAQPHELP